MGDTSRHFEVSGLYHKKIKFPLKISDRAWLEVLVLKTPRRKGNGPQDIDHVGTVQSSLSPKTCQTKAVVTEVESEHKRPWKGKERFRAFHTFQQQRMIRMIRMIRMVRIRTIPFNRTSQNWRETFCFSTRAGHWPYSQAHPHLHSPHLSPHLLLRLQHSNFFPLPLPFVFLSPFPLPFLAFGFSRWLFLRMLLPAIFCQMTLPATMAALGFWTILG